MKESKLLKYKDEIVDLYFNHIYLEKKYNKYLEV